MSSSDARSALSTFLLRLASDPKQAELARTEGLDAVDGFDELGPEARQLLEDGSLEELRVEVKMSLQVDGSTSTLIWIHVLPWLHG